MVAEVRAVNELPSDIDRLQRAAADEGHDLVSRLVEEWIDGSNRFDRPGEVMAEVRCDRSLCAIGGLNIDPYINDPGVGRIRHVFVDPAHRREGIGGLLIGFLVDHARGDFERVRLRTFREPGPPFYESLGFASTNQPDATHEVVFDRHTAAE